MTDLVYRLYRPDDVPRLSRLWQRSTEWGALSPDIVSHHIENAPFGDPIISLAEDVRTGNCVGQAALMASSVVVNGRTVRAFRPMAAIIDPDLRVHTLNPLQHPIFLLYRFGMEEMRRRGDKLIFIIPDPRWRRVIRMWPGIQHATFPLWSLRIPLAQLFPLRAGYAADELTSWDQQVDRLFDKAAGQYACLVLRDAEAFRKKCGSPEYQILGVHRAGELVGVVASKPKGDRQWLICDLIAADNEAIGETLKAACNLAQTKHAHSEGPAINKAAILVTPQLLPKVKELGFRRDTYDFHLFVKLFEGDLSYADVEPSQWYVSAND